ncbi:hypothetical protein HDU92_000534 [Lobulomyces angularis]|nr:hypothetical protein HDU92_000534 [Lobulomyces angularis]
MVSAEQINYNNKCLSIIISKFLISIWPYAPTNKMIIKKKVQIYFQKVLQLSNLPTPVILIALKYIHRLRELNPNSNGEDGFHLRIFIISLIVSEKMFSDNCSHLRCWERISGFNISDLKVMEMEFIKGINYKLYFNLDELNVWKFFILKQCLLHGLELSPAEISKCLNA